MKPVRKSRVASLLREEIARILQFEMRDPRLGFISVLSVEPTEDLKEAKVHVSTIGTDAQRRMMIRGLEAARGYIQMLLSKRVSFRETPYLKFVLDETIEKTMAIEEQIRLARDSDEEAALEREQRSN
ncbi:MAG TPA: 30S ribosome-binding factor RbfA [Planctomycetes bacterium]|nr:30S ribosome-binding factor RbfA [Planctomycetota bacterium]HIN80890.1 30S ribosome-binding factor RbfA [Planctomycetota bacterium]